MRLQGRVARRLITLAAGLLLVGAMGAAPAYAQDDVTSTDLTSTDVTADGTSTDGTSTDVTADLTSTDVTSTDVTSTDVTADLTSTDVTADLTSTDLTSTGQGGSAIVTSFVQVPDSSSNNGCGCDRSYDATQPQTVVATQVGTVPTGGVDTGDGSFGE